jgi:mRNA-degrading endonuclease YafQ of YafQ-DinJ toxin-antitoxin module
MNLMSLNHPLSGELAILRSVDVKNDFVVVVGERIQNMFAGTAVILIGKRNK